MNVVISSITAVTIMLCPSSYPMPGAWVDDDDEYDSFEHMSNVLSPNSSPPMSRRSSHREASLPLTKAWTATWEVHKSEWPPQYGPQHHGAPILNSWSLIPVEEDHFWHGMHEHSSCLSRHLGASRMSHAHMRGSQLDQESFVEKWMRDQVMEPHVSPPPHTSHQMSQRRRSASLEIPIVKSPRATGQSLGPTLRPAQEAGRRVSSPNGVTFQNPWSETPICSRFVEEVARGPRDEEVPPTQIRPVSSTSPPASRWQMPRDKVYGEAFPGACGGIFISDIERMMNSGELLEDSYGIRYSGTNLYILNNLGKGKGPADIKSLKHGLVSENWRRARKRMNIEREADWEGQRGGKLKKGTPIVSAKEEYMAKFRAGSSRPRKRVRFSLGKELLDENGEWLVDFVVDNEGKSQALRQERQRRRQLKREKKQLMASSAIDDEGGEKTSS